MADFKAEGLGVALVTPFKTDKSIDFESLEKLLHHIIKRGCDYIVVLGTTAETPTLSISERKDLADFISRKVNRDIPLVIGIGGNSTHRVIEDIKAWNLKNYSAVLSVTPYYNKPSQEGLFQHFKAIEENSDLPLMLYNVPGRTGVNLSADTALRLANYSKKFIALKEASGNLIQCKKIIDRAPEHFYVVCGDDSSTFSMMKMGAKGVISVLANALPQQVKKLLELCINSDYKDAASFQKKLNPLINHLFEDGNPTGIKALLSEMGMIENNLRLPLVAAGSNLTVKIKNDYKKILELDD